MSKEKKLEKKIKKLEVATTEADIVNEVVDKVVNAVSQDAGEKKKHRKQKKAKKEEVSLTTTAETVEEAVKSNTATLPSIPSFASVSEVEESSPEADAVTRAPADSVTLEKKVEILGNILYEMLTDQLLWARNLKDALLPVASEECQKACDAKLRKRAARPSTPQKKRRMTGYQLFCQHKRHELDDQKGGPMKMVDLAKLWKDLPEDKKEDYRKEAEALPRPATPQEVPVDQ